VFLEKRESRITGIANKKSFQEKARINHLPDRNYMPGFRGLLTPCVRCDGYCWCEAIVILTQLRLVPTSHRCHPLALLLPGEPHKGTLGDDAVKTTRIDARVDGAISLSSRLHSATSTLTNFRLSFCTAIACDSRHV
jgi:hypothetical protein